jgi:carbon storage regulator CsrA
MLILSRRLQQKIVLPSLDVTIGVVSTKAGAVCLGIDAPSETKVIREEIVARARDAAMSCAGQKIRPA